MVESIPDASPRLHWFQVYRVVVRESYTLHSVAQMFPVPPGTYIVITGVDGIPVAVLYIPATVFTLLPICTPQLLHFFHPAS